MSTQKIAELETKLGQRGSSWELSSKNRTDLRAWLMAKLDVPAALVLTIGVSDLVGIYNDTSNVRLDDCGRGLAAQAGRSPAAQAAAIAATGQPETPRQHAAPDAESAELVAAQIVKALSGLKLNAGTDEARVRVIAAEEAAKVKAPERLVILREPEGIKVQGGVQHRMFPLLLKVVQAGLNAALVGPAGSGKTHAAAEVARVLARPFELQGTCVTKSDITGFVDARGEYQDTPFARSYVRGGVLLCDEMDAWHANPTLALNAALANGHTSLPSGMVERHKDWAAIVSMNTYGNGANRQYVGRNQLDAATLDRLCFIDWAYDEALEANMAGVTRAQDALDLEEGGTVKPEAWVSRVQSLRAAVDATKARHLITPRATVGGLKLFAVGVGSKLAEEMLIWRGLDSEQRDRIEHAARKGA